jgi:hypothetical protein
MPRSKSCSAFARSIYRSSLESTSVRPSARAQRGPRDAPFCDDGPDLIVRARRNRQLPSCSTRRSRSGSRIGCGPTGCRDLQLARLAERINVRTWERPAWTPRAFTVYHEVERPFAVPRDLCKVSTIELGQHNHSRGVFGDRKRN